MENGLTDKIDDVLQMLESWSSAYPEDIFSKPTDADYAYIRQIAGLSERLFSEWGRHFINKGFLPAINLIKELQEELLERNKE